MFEDTMFDAAAMNTAKHAATAPIIPADQWPDDAHLHAWDVVTGHGYWIVPDTEEGYWTIRESYIPMPAGWDWRVPVMRPSAEEVRAQANMDAGWYARREAHAHDMGYTGVAAALEDLESRRNAPAIDLEQFWEPLVALSDYAYERHGDVDHPHCVEANRLLALIDGQAKPKRSPDEPDLCEICSTREETCVDAEGIGFCDQCWDETFGSEQPTKGKGE